MLKATIDNGKGTVEVGGERIFEFAVDEHVLNVADDTGGFLGGGTKVAGKNEYQVLTCVLKQIDDYFD